ncbi:MAG TPA: DUF952 domain-containing protein [Cyanothece sp. UBA12306]|nr:DUF952 domain-containing protein [Cyanothece sp. UBA12306]
MIFHITTLKEWEKAQKLGYYATESLEKEGFIHCSSDAQVMKVADTFYRDYQNLILLVIEPQKLISEVKWESPIHPTSNHSLPINKDETFPHVYGVINLESVVKIITLKQNGCYRQV